MSNLEKPKRNSLWYRDEKIKQKVQIPEKTYRDRTYGDVSSRHYEGGGRGVHCNLVALVTQFMWCAIVVNGNLDKDQSTDSTNKNIQSTPLLPPPRRSKG